MTIFRPDLLKGKRILVTGGGTGLGREIADEYARLGAEVYICGRRGAVVAETARELAETHNTRVTAKRSSSMAAPFSAVEVETSGSSRTSAIRTGRTSATRSRAPTRRTSQSGSLSKKR